MKIENLNIKKLLWPKSAGSKEEDSNPVSGYFSARLLRPSSLPRTLSYWLYAILIIIIISMFLPWTQNIRSYGFITTLKPENRPQAIQTAIAGRVEQWYVQEGEFVSKGDTILELSEVKDEYLDPRVLTRIEEQIEAKINSMEATEAKVEALKDQIAALREGMTLSLEKVENKIQQAREKIETALADYETAQAAYDIARQQLNRYKELYDKGLTSEQDLENYRMKLQEAQQKLISAENKLDIARRELANEKIQYSSTKADYLDKIAKAEASLNTALSSLGKIESEIFKLRNKYASVEERQSFLHIVAPQDAQVVNTTVAGIGETVKEGEAVVSILPADLTKAVALYIDPIDMPLIDEGSPVRLQFEGWPALYFAGWPDIGYGTFGGKVAVINQVATDEGKFRILVVPDEDGKRWPEQLNIGAGALGWMMLEDVPVWFEIWRQLNGFPPDYPGDLKEEDTFDEKYQKYKKKK